MSRNVLPVGETSNCLQAAKPPHTSPNTQVRHERAVIEGVNTGKARNSYLAVLSQSAWPRSLSLNASWTSRRRLSNARLRRSCSL